MSANDNLPLGYADLRNDDTLLGSTEKLLLNIIGQDTDPRFGIEQRTAAVQAPLFHSLFSAKTHRHSGQQPAHQITVELSIIDMSQICYHRPIYRGICMQERALRCEYHLCRPVMGFEQIRP